MSSTEEICGLADLILGYLSALDRFLKSRSAQDGKAYATAKKQLEQVAIEVIRDHRGEQQNLF